jgi:hypothetical protein
MSHPESVSVISFTLDHQLLHWKEMFVSFVSNPPPNRALQVTPLARPETWRFLHRRLVPSLASV